MSKKKMRGVIESIVGSNLDALMKHHKGLTSNNIVGERAKIPPRTVGRIRNAEVSCQLDTLAKLATVFRIEPWHLLIPGYDPTNPPVRHITAAERALYARLKAMARQINEPEPEAVK